jgi:hypothetical protein
MPFGDIDPCHWFILEARQSRCGARAASLRALLQLGNCGSWPL